MYDTLTRLRGDAQSKATPGGVAADLRHLHNLPGSWQDLAAQAAGRGMRFPGLPANQAEALRRRLGGGTLAEIGEDMGLSKCAVRRLLRRAQDLLREGG